MNGKMPTLNAQKWNAESLRLTVFTSMPIDVLVVQAWWEAVGGSRPEAVNSKPNLGISSVEGAWGDGRLVCTSAPGRIDWHYVPSFKDDVPGRDDLGPYLEVEDNFFVAISKWLSGVEHVSRLAYGATLRIYVEDKVAGYTTLQPYLEAVSLDIENSSEFLYQINRPRTSAAVPGLAVNRLSKWAVAASMAMLLPANPQAHEPFIPQPKTYCRLELDINTAQDWKDNLATHSVSVVNELRRLMQEIADRGDVA